MYYDCFPGSLLVFVKECVDRKGIASDRTPQYNFKMNLVDILDKVLRAHNYTRLQPFQLDEVNNHHCFLMENENAYDPRSIYWPLALSQTCLR